MTDKQIEVEIKMQVVAEEGIYKTQFKFPDGSLMKSRESFTTVDEAMSYGLERMEWLRTELSDL